jgi:hypothetical protein
VYVFTHILAVANHMHVLNFMQKPLWCKESANCLLVGKLKGRDNLENVSTYRINLAKDSDKWWPILKMAKELAGHVNAGVSFLRLTLLHGVCELLPFILSEGLCGTPCNWTIYIYIYIYICISVRAQYLLACCTYWAELAEDCKWNKQH